MIEADGTVTYTPGADFNGSDSFTYTATSGGVAEATTVAITVLNIADLSGFVFDDLNNDGLFEPGAGEAGISGIMVTLTGTDDLGAVNRQTATAGDGSYAFSDLRPGNYALNADQPTAFLDGDETAGGLGGIVDNTQDSNVIDQILAELDDPDTGGYNFANLRSSRIQGIVWEDTNNNGEVDFGETAIEGVTIRLTGTDDRGSAVDQVMQTDSQGIFEFLELRPSDASGYTLTETQPPGFVDGLDSLGTVNGVFSGSNTVNDVFSQIGMTQPGSSAINYNFGERLVDSGEIQPGQTATIGFWQNKNGQALIRSLGGSPDSTQLANWLAATFPNMHGAAAGPNDMTGMTNDETADFYKSLFNRNKKTAAGAGPPKVDAQAMAVALAVYVTNENLAGTVAESYGFTVSETGVGTHTINVGSNGAAFGVTDNSDVSVMDLLLATNARSVSGLLFDLDGDDDIDEFEKVFRTMANEVFTAINEQGDI